MEWQIDPERERDEETGSKLWKRMIIKRYFKKNRKGKGESKEMKEIVEVWTERMKKKFFCLVCVCTDMFLILYLQS